MKNKKILILGANSFIASHLIDYIIKHKYDVSLYGTINKQDFNLNQEYLKNNKIKLDTLNILDINKLNSIINKIKPDTCYNFIAQSYVPISWKQPTETYKINVIGQSNLLEAIRRFSKETVVIITGSSEEYGKVSFEDCPVTEEQQLNPVSPYATSKVCADLMAQQYFHSYGLRVIRLRGFNFSGPRRPSKFVDSSFVRQCVEIELNLREPTIAHGNLTTTRDFTHIDDVTRAYWLADGFCSVGDVYNICSQEPTKISDLLTKIVERCLNKNIELKQDTNLMRPSDVPFLTGNNKKFCKMTDWYPKKSVEQMIDSLYEDWRKQLTK